MFSGGGGFRQCVDLFGESFINKQLGACGEGAGVWLEQALVPTAPCTEGEALPKSWGAVTRANPKGFLQQTVAKLIIWLILVGGFLLVLRNKMGSCGLVM